jgi:hypothetical protein
MFNGTGNKLPPEDILVTGMGIIQIVDEVISALYYKKEDKYVSITHRIVKIRKMLEMSNFNDIMMTKFICKTKHSYQSRTTIGEKFCSLNIYLGVFPTQNIEPLLHQELIDIDIDELLDGDVDIPLISD